MIITAISDLHLTDKKPKNRSDVYFETCLEKFDWILGFSKKYSDALIIGGDVFDYPSVPRWFLGRIFKILRKYEQKIFVIPGQHDLRYHVKGLENTSLGVLINSGYMTLLKPDKKYMLGNASIVGLGWEEKLEEKSGDILVTHQMVTEFDPLWEGQTGYSTAPMILHKHKGFKCVISGDNHKCHSYINDAGQVNVNCGSVMRSKKDQINFDPRIWIIDTDNFTDVEYEYVPIKDAKKVFDFSRIELEEKKAELQEQAKEKMDKLIKKLGNKNKPDYKKVVRNLVKETKPNDRVKSIIADVMEEVF